MAHVSHFLGIIMVELCAGEAVGIFFLFSDKILSFILWYSFITSGVILNDCSMSIAMTNFAVISNSSFSVLWSMKSFTNISAVSSWNRSWILLWLRACASLIIPGGVSGSVFVGGGGESIKYITDVLYLYFRYVNKFYQLWFLYLQKKSLEAINWVIEWLNVLDEVRIA